MKFLIVKSIETLTSANSKIASGPNAGQGRKYNKVRLSGPTTIMQLDEVTGIPFPIKVQAVEATAIGWLQSPLTSILDQVDHVGSFAVGEKVAGAIVKRTVAPYELLDKLTGDVRTITSYSTPVFGNTDDVEGFEVAVRAAFRNADHPLEGDTARVAKPATAASPAAAPVSADLIS